YAERAGGARKKQVTTCLADVSVHIIVKGLPLTLRTRGDARRMTWRDLAEPRTQRSGVSGELAWFAHKAGGQALLPAFWKNGQSCRQGRQECLPCWLLCVARIHLVGNVKNRSLQLHQPDVAIVHR